MIILYIIGDGHFNLAIGQNSIPLNIEEGLTTFAEGTKPATTTPVVDSQGIFYSREVLDGSADGEQNRVSNIVSRLPSIVNEVIRNNDTFKNLPKETYLYADSSIKGSGFCEVVYCKSSGQRLVNIFLHPGVISKICHHDVEKQAEGLEVLFEEFMHANQRVLNPKVCKNTDTQSPKLGYIMARIKQELGGKCSGKLSASRHLPPELFIKYKKEIKEIFQSDSYKQHNYKAFIREALDKKLIGLFDVFRFTSDFNQCYDPNFIVQTFNNANVQCGGNMCEVVYEEPSPKPEIGIHESSPFADLLNAGTSQRIDIEPNLVNDNVVVEEIVPVVTKEELAQLQDEFENLQRVAHAERLVDKIEVLRSRRRNGLREVRYETQQLRNQVELANLRREAFKLKCTLDKRAIQQESEPEYARANRSAIAVREEKKLKGLKSLGNLQGSPVNRLTISLYQPQTSRGGSQSVKYEEEVVANTYSPEVRSKLVEKPLDLSVSEFERLLNKESRSSLENLNSQEKEVLSNESSGNVMTPIAETISSQLVAKQDDISQLNLEIEKQQLIMQVQELERRIEDSTAATSQAHMEVSRLKADLQQQQQQARQEAGELIRRVGELERELRDSNTATSRAHMEVSRLQADLHQQQQARQEAQDRANVLRSELDHSQESKQELREELVKTQEFAQSQQTSANVEEPKRSSEKRILERVPVEVPVVEVIEVDLNDIRLSSVGKRKEYFRRITNSKGESRELNGTLEETLRSFKYTPSRDENMRKLQDLHMGELRVAIQLEKLFEKVDKLNFNESQELDLLFDAWLNKRQEVETMYNSMPATCHCSVCKGHWDPNHFGVPVTDNK